MDPARSVSTRTSVAQASRRSGSSSGLSPCSTTPAHNKLKPQRIMPHASLTDVANEDLGVGPAQSDDVVRDGARAHVYIRLDVTRPSEIPLHHLLAEDTGS